MIVGVDASNISGGGGLTHLVELLGSADPARHGFSRVVLWASQRTLDRVADRGWLDKRTEPVLQRGFIPRSFWQRFRLRRLAERHGCAVLFVPGGSFSNRFAPVVTMSRNLLPFEWKEMRRYGWSFAALKQLLLRFTQSRSYRRAAGTIFLTRYAHDTVTRCTGPLRGATQIIPHGLDARFLQPPRPQRALAEYDAEAPFRLLYVSQIDHYKHQWHVASAVAQLRAEGLPVAIDFVGTATPSAARRLDETLDRLDPERRFLRRTGPVEHAQLHQVYAAADGFVYASSCENLPNILLEAMASGLPIACSGYGPMPEVLGASGSYFDPEDPQDIARAIRGQLLDPALRERLAQGAFTAAQRYRWSACADATFALLRQVAPAA
jgi:glycosyltransferase involved in cell wall biosynthesis